MFVWRTGWLLARIVGMPSSLPRLAIVCPTSMFLKSLIFHQKVLTANVRIARPSLITKDTNFPIGTRKRDVAAYLRPPRRMAPLEREEPPLCDFNRMIGCSDAQWMPFMPDKAEIGQNGFHEPYRQDQRNPSTTRSKCLASIRKSVYFRTRKSGIAAHPGFCDKGERAQFPLAIIYALLKKS
jgi:hypothetical protein